MAEPGGKRSSGLTGCPSRPVNPETVHCPLRGVREWSRRQLNAEPRMASMRVIFALSRSGSGGAKATSPKKPAGRDPNDPLGRTGAASSAPASTDPAAIKRYAGRAQGNTRRRTTTSAAIAEPPQRRRISPDSALAEVEDHCVVHVGHRSRWAAAGLGTPPRTRVDPGLTPRATY
jgi:hypothetical protein